MDKSQNITLAHGTDTASFDNGSIFFSGTATVIIRYAGFTILTDPNFLHKGDHVHLGYGLTSKRVTEPALSADNLPPFDLCILSHMHGDHFDRIAEEKLDKNLPFITNPHAAASLKRKGFKQVYSLKCWENISVTKNNAKLTLTAMPGRHAPSLLQLAIPPVMGSMIEFKTSQDKIPLRLYISGDTLLIKELNEIPKRYPDIDLGLFHLGGTRIFGVMLTMDARQGVEAIKIINPDISIPIHYNDYTVFKSPLEDFKNEVKKAGLEKMVRYLSHGDTYNFEIPESRFK